MSSFSSEKITAFVKEHPYVLYGGVGLIVFYFIYKKLSAGSSASQTTGGTTTISGFDPAQAQYALQAEQLQNQQNQQTAQLNLQAQALQDQTIAQNNATSAAAETGYMQAQSNQLTSIANIVQASTVPELQFGAQVINGIQNTNNNTIDAAALMASNQMSTANQAIGSIAAALGSQGTTAENALTQAGIGASNVASNIVQSNAAITGGLFQLAGTAMMLA